MKIVGFSQTLQESERIVVLNLEASFFLFHFLKPKNPVC